MITSVLGAPGSGKSTVAPLLATVLTSHVVLDWDAFMGPAGDLAGHEVRDDPTTWPAYARLVRIVVDSVLPAPMVLLGVCTPDELDQWPIDAWILLDCSDDERRTRLSTRLDRAAVADALADGRRYRTFDMPTIDTTGRAAELVVTELAHLVRANRR
jgi:broad-specificity NMP kinase